MRASNISNCWFLNSREPADENSLKTKRAEKGFQLLFTAGETEIRAWISTKSLSKYLEPTIKTQKGHTLGIKTMYQAKDFSRSLSEELTHFKRPWCWERLRAWEERDNRGWDDWMASLTQWTLVWVDSGSWWWTGRPGVLWFMGSWKVGHDWVAELNWIELNWMV